MQRPRVFSAFSHEIGTVCFVWSIAMYT